MKLNAIKNLIYGNPIDYYETENMPKLWDAFAKGARFWGK